ncbi:MAG TPA: prolipoprotein diacylglyceryl transferase [Dehalococcoidales bacterium]|nr:prolipoprotein diacylglyceryl transferase [Dehalococcoidales bacterium]
MNGIVINIDPVILRLGTFELRWYSLAIMLAVVAAVLITAYRAKKKGIAADHVYSLALWVVLGGIVGARLFHVIDRWEYYAGHPLHILQFQQGGLAIWGALAGGGLVLLLYARIKHLPLGRLADTIAPGLLVAQIIGRFGCIVNGDAYGGLTDLPWAFIYTHPDALIPAELHSLPTHPYPVYEIIWNALVLLLVLRLERYFKRDGMVFLSYLPVYALGRLLLTFVRQESITLWGLQQAQVIAMLVILVGVLAMISLLVRRRPASQLN